MTIRDIKTAINNVIISNGGSVYSNETDEGYQKPAFFVEIIPVRTTRISSVYDEVDLFVEIHYEPAVLTEEECLRVADKIDEWFSVPIVCGDRNITPPEEIEHTTDDDIVLYSSFNLTITKIHNESAYDGQPEPTMEELQLNLNIEGGI